MIHVTVKGSGHVIFYLFDADVSFFALQTPFGTKPMTEIDRSLCERLKQLGYTKNKHLRMYGEDFDLLSDPEVVHDRLVVVDVVVRKSGVLRRLSIPLSAVQMVRNEKRAA